MHIHFSHKPNIVHFDSMQKHQNPSFIYLPIKVVMIQRVTWPILRISSSGILERLRNSMGLATLIKEPVRLKILVCAKGSTLSETLLVPKSFGKMVM